VVERVISREIVQRDLIVDQAQSLHTPQEAHQDLIEEESTEEVTETEREVIVAEAQEVLIVVERAEAEIGP
jgi:hypothetical protein